MELNILNEGKESIEVQLDNLTLVEILRVYLNKDSDVKFAVWKRDHPTKNPILTVKSKNPKKSIKEAVSAIVKDLDRIEKDFSKLK